MCSILHSHFFAHIKILDEPGPPEGVQVFEIPDDRKSRGICVLNLQLNHPSNVDLDEIFYHVEYQSRQENITTTSYTFVVQNCTQDLRINVTAVNRCGRMGGRVVDIIPDFLPESEVTTVAPTRDISGKNGIPTYEFLQHFQYLYIIDYPIL